MINQEQIAAYREMAKNAGENSMEAQIRANLEATCDKFAGNEDKLDRCISYLEDCASQILDGKSGDVPDEVCFRICRDYFNDEIWKKEDEEAEKEKAEEEKRAAERNAKEAKKAAKASKSKVITSKASLDKMTEIKGDDVPVQVLPPKTKPVEGQLDLFAALGV